MTDSDDRELRVLSAARRAFTPVPGDAHRIRTALETTLSGALLSEALRAADGAQATAAPSTSAPTATASATRWLGRLALPALVATGGFAGYELGYRTGLREGSALVTATTPPKPVPESVAVPTSTTGKTPELPGPALPATAPLPVPKAAAPVTGENAAAAATPGLDEEVRQLRRVEHALRSKNPRYALALLGELERDVPKGQLAEERDAARAMARCELGVGGEALARDFEAAHPGSAYARRVTESCAKAPKESRE